MSSCLPASNRAANKCRNFLTNLQMADDYQISYRISKNASSALIFLFFIFLAGVAIKAFAIWIQPVFFDIVFLIIFFIFLIFSATAIWIFLIKKQPVLSISSKHVSVAVPYFFQTENIPLINIKEIKVSVWSRSEIVFQSGLDLRKLSFMSTFLSTDDRESFMSNIFDLLPKIQMK
jgi:hypothetical protein